MQPNIYELSRLISLKNMHISPGKKTKIKPTKIRRESSQNKFTIVE